MSISVPKLKLACEWWHECRGEHKRECSRLTHSNDRHHCIYCTPHAWHDPNTPKPEGRQP